MRAIKINGSKLREYLDTMHSHADARDLQSESIRKVVQTAKSDGFDGKALRKVFVRERMDAEQRQHDDDLLAAYEGALGAKGRALKAIEAGAGVVEAAEANGVHRATLARARHVAKQAENATDTIDPATGEVIESSGSGGERTPVAVVEAVVDAASAVPQPAAPLDDPWSAVDRKREKFEAMRAARLKRDAA